MDIQHIGSTSFKLKGKTATILTNTSSFKVEVEKEVKMEIAEPGEYEIGGISIIGTVLGSNKVFVFEIDGLRVAYLGDFKGVITDEKVSELGSIDVLIINVGVSAKESVKVVGGIDPYFVLPFSEKEPLETFLSESGLTVEKLDKFSLKREDIMEDQSTKIVLLPTK
jgi:hypothetical protein